MDDSKSFLLINVGFADRLNALQWESLEAHTAPPYTLSLKSNGCIIFIAALSSTKLLVTSKHSLGPLSHATRSHSQVGEEWLHKHLEKAGKSTEELAATLFSFNWTAIAEVRLALAVARPFANWLWISCAMMTLRNTSYHTPQRSRGSIFTALTRIPKISAHSPPKLSTSLQTSGVS